MSKSPLQVDPTQTALQRKGWMLAIQHLFKAVEKSLYQLLVKDDAFGLVANFDPNEKRDTKGRWTATKSVIYHGTAVDVAKKILKEGLKLSASRFGGVTKHGSTIYATQALEEAKGWGATESIGGKYAVVHIKKGVKPIEVQGNTFLFNKDIPASKIAKIEIYSRTDNYSTVGHKLIKTLTNNQESNWYVVVRLEEDLTINFNPSEPRDKSGKWTSKLSSDEFAGLKESQRLNLPVALKVRAAPSCAGGFGDCTSQAFQEYKSSGAAVYHGYAITKENLARTEREYKKLVAKYGASEVGPHTVGSGAFPHAWNIKNGEIYDRALGSKEAKEHVYFGKRIPNDVLDKMQSGDEIAKLTINASFKSQTRAQQVDQFQNWIRLQLLSLIDNKNRDTESEYWRKYIEGAYKKGSNRAFEQVRRPKLSVADEKKLAQYVGAKDEFLRAAAKESLERIQLLSARVLNELEGVTNTMAQKLTRILIDGFTQGKNPKAIAADMAKQVGISKTQAEMIAQTEITRAHAEGQLTAMKALGVTHVNVLVEWQTAKDTKVCKLCHDMKNVVLTIDEAFGLIPRHPRCRCAFVPVQVRTRWQKRTQREIQQAIDKSLRDETGKRTNKEARRKSKWAGAKVKLRDRRKLK